MSNYYAGGNSQLAEVFGSPTVSLKNTLSQQQAALCTTLPALPQLLPSLEWSLQEIVGRKYTQWLRTETIRWKFLAWVKYNRQHDQNNPFSI